MIHPISVFVILQIIWVAITVLWVTWVVDRNAELSSLARSLGSESFDRSLGWLVLAIGLVLLAILLVGTVMLFVFGVRQSHLYRQQRNFISSVTHELKSPLASLQLAFETLDHRKLDDATQSKIQKMMQADTERLVLLVDRILVSARLDRGISIFERDQVEPIYLKEFLTSIGERSAQLKEHIDHRIQFICDEDVSLRTSRQALFLVVSNLIENAIKYSPPHTQVTVEGRKLTDAVQISVKDRGIGLNDKEKKKIFKMFQRGEQALHKAIPGTGLGLFIVRSAVRMMGGKVWAESAGRNLGSVFTVSFPIARKE